MRRSAAAMVLTELAPDNTSVVKALGDALPEASPQLSIYILEALQAIGSPDAVPYVMPLLCSQDLATRMRASAIIAGGGNAVVPEIRKQFKDVPRLQKLVFIDLLARIHTVETLQMLLDFLFEPDFGLVKETCDAVKRHASGAEPGDRLKLHTQIVKFMNSAPVKAQERVLTSSLLLLGHVRRPEAASIILKYCTPKTSPYVRRHALIALKGVDFVGKTVPLVLKAIFPYLEETDEEVVRHSIETIQRMPSPDISPAQWKKLLKNSHPYARALGARMLSGPDNNDSNLLLIDLLKHEDNELREIAANGLAGHQKATPLLLKALAAEGDIDKAWMLAKILKTHAAAIDKKTVKKVSDLAGKAMLAGSPGYEPLLYLVRNLDPKEAEAVLLETGMAHKKAKHWAMAVDCLRRLLHTQTFNDEVSYALSVSDLKVSKKDLSTQFRTEDHALRGFTSLYRHNSAELLAKLKKDKDLDASDLYFVGFHFHEAAGPEKAFGEELLKHLAKTWPKSAQAKDVKARLKP